LPTLSKKLAPPRQREENPPPAPFEFAKRCHAGLT